MADRAALPDSAHLRRVAGTSCESTGSADLERVELLYTSLLLQATRELIHVRPDEWGESTAAYRRSWLAGFASGRDSAAPGGAARRRRAAGHPRRHQHRARPARPLHACREAVATDYPGWHQRRRRDLTGSAAPTVRLGQHAPTSAPAASTAAVPYPLSLSEQRVDHRSDCVWWVRSFGGVRGGAGPARRRRRRRCARGSRASGVAL